MSLGEVLLEEVCSGNGMSMLCFLPQVCCDFRKLKLYLILVLGAFSSMTALDDFFTLTFQTSQPFLY